MTSRAAGQDWSVRLRRLVSPLRRIVGENNDSARIETGPALRDTQPVAAPRRYSNGERVEALQRSLQVRFNDPTLLREALTHRSYLNEINQAWPSNERLEFLGDSVLGMISTDYLYRRFDAEGEGELTNLRS